jgi:hypothetical protein
MTKHEPILPNLAGKCNDPSQHPSCYSKSFVAVIVDVKQEKTHHQKIEKNHVNVRLKGIQKARQRFLNLL